MHALAVVNKAIQDSAVTQGLSKTEARNMVMGRPLLLSGVIESGLLGTTGSEDLGRCSEAMMKGLLEYYRTHVWVQSMVAGVIAALLTALASNTSALEPVLAALSQAVGAKQIKGKLDVHISAARMSELLLVLMLKKCAKLLGRKCKTHLFECNERQTKDLLLLFQEQVPTALDTVPLVLEEYLAALLNSPKRPQKFATLWQRVLLPAIQAQVQVQDSLAVEIVSFLLLIRLFRAKTGLTLAEAQEALTAEYVRMWARAMHGNTAARNFANEAERHFSDFVEAITSPPAGQEEATEKGKQRNHTEEEEKGEGAEAALTLLKRLFGPDPKQHFTPTRHAKLYKALVLTLKPDQLSDYLHFLTQSFETGAEGHPEITLKEMQLYAFTQLTNVLAFSNVTIQSHRVASLG